MPRRQTPQPEQTGTRMTAIEIHDNVLVAAEEELERSAGELVFSGIAAGLTMGLSFIAGGYLTTLVAEPFHRAVVALGYPLGFILVVLARSQLFTENTLEPVIPVLNRRDRKTFASMLRLWGIVLSANLVGALGIAWCAADTPMLPPSLHAPLLAVASTATAGGFALVAYQAVFGGWLVGLMAWLVASTRATGAQIALVWLTTAPIAAFGFRHSIVGAVEAFYRALAGDASWAGMLGAFLLPSVLGNIAGGVGLVALLNYGQVASKDRGGLGRRRG